MKEIAKNALSQLNSKLKICNSLVKSSEEYKEADNLSKKSYILINHRITIDNSNYIYALTLSCIGISIIESITN